MFEFYILILEFFSRFEDSILYSILMIKKSILLLLFPFYVHSQIPKGLWQGEFRLNDSTSLPVKFDVKGSSIEFINAQEKIKVTEISYKDDSAFIQMPVFDSEIRCKIKGDTLL